MNKGQFPTQAEMMSFGSNGSPKNRPGSSGGYQNQNASKTQPISQLASGQPSYPSTDFFQTAGDRGGLCAGRPGQGDVNMNVVGEKSVEQIEKENAVQQMRDQGFNTHSTLGDGIINQIERKAGLMGNGNGEFVTDEQFRRRAGA